MQLCLVALFVVAPSRGRADDYPSRPIHLIVTSPAGSLVDVIGRLVAQGLGERLGQPVVVDNRPGAMTQLGTDVLVHADPDGYTLMIGPSELAILPFEKKGYPYDPTKDITPIALMTTSWTMFAIYPKLPPQTLPEFIAYAKANPGKLHYGTNGVGGALHLAVEMLKLKTGIDIVHVPYRGGEQAATDAMAGQIEMVSMGLASARVAQGGKLRVLAQTGPTRHPLFPDVPTTAEYGLARRAHGYMVRPGRAAEDAGRDRRPARARCRRARTATRLSRCAGQDRLCARLSAARSIRRLHRRRLEEMAKAHSRFGHSADRVKE